MRPHQVPARRWSTSAAVIASLAAALSAVLAGPAHAQRKPALPPPEKLAEAPRDPGRQNLSLESGNGRVITLSGPAANVFVADPRVAEVRPASTNSLFVFGVGPGRTTIAAMDSEGKPVAQYDVVVRPSTFVAGEAETAIARLLPNSRIRVTPQSRGLLLTGTVGSPADAARAVSIMRGYMPENQQVENQLSVQSSVQVNMRVRIVEMNRSATRALGIDWAAIGNIGKVGIGGATNLGLAGGLTPVGVAAIAGRGFTAVIDALAQDNLVRVLAEPNLTVMSGQPGSFLAGGEFPVPVGQRDGVIAIEFKKYGVTLNVVPTVLSDGRINLHVSPEVSKLTDEGAVRLTAGSISLSVPALTVRRAETSVELGSGQTFAIAGLLSDQSTQSVTSIPFLGDLPIIGALFRSTAFQRQETELVILVTPYIVNPVNDPGTLRTPSDKYTPPNDFERILLLRQTGAAPATQASLQSRIPGAAGFIVQ